MLEFIIFCGLVAKVAPDWNGTAVIGDPPSFKEIRLSDYKGIYIYNYMYCRTWQNIPPLFFTGKYLVFFFYPLDLWEMIYVKYILYNYTVTELGFYCCVFF